MIDMETVFTFANAFVLAGWLALLLAPRAPKLADRIASVVIPLLLAIAYLVLAPVFFTFTEGGFDSLANVMILFDNPRAVMAGWLHYLAFDLFIGAWQVRQARAHNIRHLVIIPSLILTLLLGPVGLLAFFITRFAYTKRLFN
ncbi:MAG: ABA4-like family protein [Lentilitoribacter sp.]